MNVEIPARWYSFLGVRMTLLTLRLANSSSIRKGKCEAKLCKAREWNLDAGEQIISFVQKKQKCKYCPNPRLLSLSWIIEFQFRNWPIPIFRYNENRPLSSRFSELNCLKTNKQTKKLSSVRMKKKAFSILDATTLDLWICEFACMHYSISWVLTKSKIATSGEFSTLFSTDDDTNTHL